eukprot:TRINITY_DN37114_c0_g1_i1.p2 TRINITY_DN37114_c0_g1~~TRINITY_DN37114_c0_g1_i1.p2  ORF type:complete len:179 (-),score=22.90 TRINITY_DN37114_c0_g1_i1:261-797(-)
MNLSVAYGIASVPLVAAKYNLLMEDFFHVARINVRDVPRNSSKMSTAKQAAAFWSQRIAPGFGFSLLRDTGSIGGAIVVGPILVRQLEIYGTAPTNLTLFGCGVLAGSICGLCTQVLHNAALTAGRMQMTGEPGGHIQAAQWLIREHGIRALWLNFPMRVGAIASFSAILNVTQPFRD